MTNLNQALGGHQQQIRQILVADLVHRDVAQRQQGVGRRRLAGLARCSTQLSKGDAAIANGIDTIGPAVSVLSSENIDFSNLLTATTRSPTWPTPS